MKRLALRRSDRCRACGVELDPGVEAWWDKGSKTVTCLTCAVEPVFTAAGAVLPVDAAPTNLAGPSVTDADAGPPPAAHPVAGATGPDLMPLSDDLRGVAGASAREERARRSARREERIRSKHPKLGGVIVALSDDPTSTKVWDQGAVGEELVGALLDEARPRGLEVLHDRRIPRSRANIDHLVVAPSGIWVVDAKRYLSGKLECRDVGGWFSTDRRLYVGDRDQSKLLDGVAKQVDLVRGALAATPFAGVPVRGALCFVGTGLGFFAKPFELGGIRVTWRKHLVDPLLVPVDGGLIEEHDRIRAATLLATAFRPA